LKFFFFWEAWPRQPPPWLRLWQHTFECAAKWFTVADFHSATKTAAGFTVYAGSPWDITAQR